jgi:hypothetical protein
MQNKHITHSFVTIASVVAVMVFVGAGCQKSAPSVNNQTADNSGNNSNNSYNSNNDNQTSPSEVYSKAVDVDVADATDRATAEQMKALVSAVFGNVKTSGYISDVLGNSALSLEYTLSRPSTSEDVRKLTEILKQKNYTVDQTTVYDGTAVVGASNKTVQLNISFTMGEQKISILYLPIEPGTSANGD